MGILLIDSSSKKIEFGFGQESRNALIIREELDPENNADTLAFFIKKAFDVRGINFREIKYVSLSNGPGSFTGLRIGSAIAKGICFAAGSSLIEIPTLDIIANKYIMGFAASEEHQDKDIISLVYSNTKTREFYYCRYRSDRGGLIRLSDYKMDTLENILKLNCKFVLNELGPYIERGFLKRITDVSNLSNLDSQSSLAKDYIKKNKFREYRDSEPFYMNEFIPKSV